MGKVKPSKNGYRGSQSGMRKLMKTAPVSNMVMSATRRISDTANGFGYTFKPVFYEQAVSLHGYVFPVGIHAVRAQAKYDILQKALHG